VNTGSLKTAFRKQKSHFLEETTNKRVRQHQEEERLGDHFNIDSVSSSSHISRQETGNLLTLQREKRELERSEVLAYLQSPECRMFSDAITPVVVSDSDLRMLLRRMREAGSSTVEQLRVFDERLVQFRSFKHLLRAITLEPEQELLHRTRARFALVPPVRILRGKSQQARTLSTGQNGVGIVS
jgi:hypothetical protein